MRGLTEKQTSPAAAAIRRLFSKKRYTIDFDYFIPLVLCAFYFFFFGHPYYLSIRQSSVIANRALHMQLRNVYYKSIFSLLFYDREQGKKETERGERSARAWALRGFDPLLSHGAQSCARRLSCTAQLNHRASAARTPFSIVPYRSSVKARKHFIMLQLYYTANEPSRARNEGGWRVAHHAMFI